MNLKREDILEELQPYQSYAFFKKGATQKLHSWLEKHKMCYWHPSEAASETAGPSGLGTKDLTTH